MTKYIPRLAESHILRLSKSFPIVAIVGPRQVGKTSLANHISSLWNRPIMYLDLENPTDWNKMNDPLLFLEPLQDTTIILDEVQRVPELFPILRGVIDRHRIAGRFILLGSASPDLIRNASESLAGRIAYFELSPLSYLEIQEKCDYRQHWLRGGFPDSLLAENDLSSLDWRDNFIKTYLERDLPMLGLSANPVLTRRLWTMLAHWNGNLMNYETIGNSLGISSPTIKRYIDFFESSYLIRRLQPWYVNISKRLVRSPKIYIRDTGVLHALLAIGNFEELQGHPSLGASWEAYIIQELMTMLPPRYELYYYRTQDGTEADAVIVKGGVPHILVEIKYSSSPSITKGMRIAAADLATTRQVIVTPDNESYPLKDGFEVLSYKDLASLFE
jgi:uncharacterized protein